MTARTGHPDYQSFVSTQSPNLFGATVASYASGFHGSTIIPVANWSSVHVTVMPSAGAGRVEVLHFADLAGTQLIGQDTWDVTTTTALDVVTPLRGPYLQVAISNTGVPTLTVFQFANMLSGFVDRISFPIGTQVAAKLARTLPANTTDIFSTAFLCKGNAQLMFAPFDNTGKLLVFVLGVDELGNPQETIANLGNPTTPQNVPIQLPDHIINVHVVNQDLAAGHEYDCSVICPAQ
jgi:hypothetical protein